MPGETDKVLWRGVQPVLGISGIWPARDSVRVAGESDISGDEEKNVYTVAVGKILFLTDTFLSSRLTSDGTGATTIYVQDTNNDRVYRLILHAYSKAGQLSNNERFFPALQIPAGYDVQLYGNNANLAAWCGFWGWLEDE